MNALPKYVLTHGQADSDWNNSHHIELDAIAQIKQRARRPLTMFAGAQAAQSALDAGHVDELRLVQFPVVLGGGTPLFAVDGLRRDLTPLEHHTFPGGPTVTHYRAGSRLTSATTRRPGASSASCEEADGSRC